MDFFEELIIGELKEKQRMSLTDKIEYSKAKIVEFVEKVGGPERVFISFSGGKDSTVLLHLVRSLYPGVRAVFFDTGLEYPEIRQFTKTIENVEWVKPKKTVTQVWRECGIPVVSKEQSNYIYDVRHLKEGKTVEKRLGFREGYNISKKWIFLTDKEFTEYEPSHYCCKYFKKNPSDNYVKENNAYPIVGTMAGESKLRLNSWVKHSCNMFTGKKIQSRPLSIWTEQDIWDYIEQFDLKICELYYQGHKRTGCFLCPYGAHMDKSEKNKFELLYEQHPKQYKSLEQLGIKRVLMDMGVRISNDEEYMIAMEERQKEIKSWYEKVEQDISEKGVESEYYRYYKYFQKQKTCETQNCEICSLSETTSSNIDPEEE